MSADAKITVIVPVYNVEKYLDKCIESIVNQTYKNLEIILVDDGSTDGSPVICDEWANKDYRIKVVHKNNKGASCARNSGLEIASGDYITFVDSDDYVDTNLYESLFNLLKKYGADAAACGMVRESCNGYKEVWADHSIHEFCRNDLLKWIGEASGILPVSPCNKLFSKDSIKNIKFDENLKYAEDTLFNFEVAQNIDKLVLFSEPLYHYVNNSDSVSHISFDEHRFDEHRVMDKIFALSSKDADVFQYCVKGDVLKSFRTIKEMCVSGNCINRFNEIRNRIISHKTEILKSGIYSRATKFKTVFLFIAPNVYKIMIKSYGKYSIHKFERLTEK